MNAKTQREIQRQERAAEKTRRALLRRGVCPNCNDFRVSLRAAVRTSWQEREALRDLLAFFDRATSVESWTAADVARLNQIRAIAGPLDPATVLGLPIAQVIAQVGWDYKKPRGHQK